MDWTFALIIGTTALILFVAYCIFIDERKKNKNALDELASEIKYLKIYRDQVEAEKWKNWGDDNVVKGPFKLQFKEPAKQCTFSQWEISEDRPGGHYAFCKVYGKGNAEKVLKALNNTSF